VDEKAKAAGIKNISALSAGESAMPLSFISLYRFNWTLNPEP